MASDFTYDVDEVQEDIEYNTLISQFENYVEQRRQKWSANRRTFSLTARNRTQSEFENIRDFFLSKEGQLTSFTWTNPIDDVEYTVRFVDGSLTSKLKRFEIFDLSWKFIQVYS